MVSTRKSSTYQKNSEVAKETLNSFFNQVTNNSGFKK